MSVFSERLQERRTKLGMTQAAVGAACDVTGTTITNLETGRSAPSPRLLEKLCRLMDTRPDYFLGWSNVFKSKVVPRRSAFDELVKA